MDTVSRILAVSAAILMLLHLCSAGIGSQCAGDSQCMHEDPGLTCSMSRCKCKPDVGSFMKVWGCNVDSDCQQMTMGAGKPASESKCIPSINCSPFPGLSKYCQIF